MATTPHLFSNETQHLYPQCKIVIYPWNTVINTSNLSDDVLSGATSLDISSQITNFTYSKNMSAPAGSFSFGLTNSPNYGTNDWKDIIKRGFWVVAYLSQEGELVLNPEVGPNLTKSPKSEAKKIRMIGYVDRVGANLAVQENRSLDVNFTVTGRDFGIVYEQSEIWHNFFKFDQIMIDSVKTSQLNVVGNTRIHVALQLIHDLFYYPSNIPGAKVNDNKSLLSIGLQWLMPRKLLVDIGMNLSTVNNGAFWGALPDITDFSPTNAGIAVASPADFLSGNAWEQLKRISIPQFHELFTEMTDDGLPNLVFRPIPWSIDQSKYPKTAQYITKYKDITDVVQVAAVNLIDADVGEDDHARYNSFLATISTTLFNTEDNVPLILGADYPKNNYASIKRHGFRPMHVTIDSIVRNTDLANGSADKDQLIEFNELLFDYWNQSIYSESGSVNIFGLNDTRVGKCMKFNSDVPYLCTKRYYIEGYADSWAVDDKGAMEWTQTVNLTRGFEEADLKAQSGFSERNEEFKAPGEYTPRNRKS